MAVKAHADPRTGTADDVLLLLVLKEIKEILMLVVVMDGIVADVHLPEDVLVGHALEVVQRICAQLSNMTEQVGMGDTHHGGTAPLGVGEQVSPRHRHGAVQILNEAVVVKGDVRIVGDDEVRVIHVEQGAKLDAPQDADLVGVLVLDQVDVVKVAAQGALVIVVSQITRGSQGAVAAVADGVVMVGDAEEVQSSRNGGLHDGLGSILSAEGIVGMGMKILKHNALLIG